MEKKLSTTALSQQLPVGHGPILAALIGVDQELLGFDLTVPQSPVQGLQHQRGLHRGAHSPADYAAAVKVDPDRQIPPSGCGADVGDVTSPAVVRCQGRKVLLQQVLRDPRGLTAVVATSPEATPGLGPER